MQQTMQHVSTRALIALALALACASCAVEDEATWPDSGGQADATVATDRGTTSTDGVLPDQGQQAGVLTLPGKLGLDLSRTATTQGARS